MKPDLCAEIGRRAQIEHSLKSAADTAESANRAHSAFLSHLSHELRTSVLQMMGTAYLLRNAPLTREQADLVRTLCQDGESVLSRLNDVIELSSLATGLIALDHSEFDLAEQLRRATNLHRDEASRKQLALSIEIDPALPARLRGDPIRLQQIVINLVDNAVKFTDAGSIRLRVRLEEARPECLRLRFEIVDTGIGIPAAVQAMLFRPFVPTNPASRQPTGGIGFGLAICKQLAALMHGEIGVESAEGAGARFWFTAELQPGNAPAGATSA